jgi:hypothetical protein
VAADCWHAKRGPPGGEGARRQNGVPPSPPDPVPDLIRDLAGHGEAPEQVRGGDAFPLDPPGGARSWPLDLARQAWPPG